jgi:hypothetical protein
LFSFTFVSYTYYEASNREIIQWLRKGIENNIEQNSRGLF